MNIYDLISRAQKLRQETKLDSVSPDRVGALCEDTLKYINEFQLLASSPSLHKIYASVSAMQADKSPKSDLTGKALKPGQLVVIVPANQSDATAGDVYRYDGPSGNTSAWTFVSNIGAVPVDAELNATSANPVQNKVVTEKLTELSATLKELQESGVGATGNLTGYVAKDSVSELPTEKTTFGYLIGTHLYVYVGTGGDVNNGTYKDCGEFRGPRGEKGEKGEQGEIGPQGETGPQGEKGEQGNSGYTGAADELKIVNNLTEGGASAALSAEMGKEMNNAIKDISLTVIGGESLDALPWVKGTFLNSYGQEYAPGNPAICRTEPFWCEVGDILVFGKLTECNVGKRSGTSGGFTLVIKENGISEVIQQEYIVQEAAYYMIGTYTEAFNVYPPNKKMSVTGIFEKLASLEDEVNNITDNVDIGYLNEQLYGDKFVTYPAVEIGTYVNSYGSVASGQAATKFATEVLPIKRGETAVMYSQGIGYCAIGFRTSTSGSFLVKAESTNADGFVEHRYTAIEDGYVVMSSNTVAAEYYAPRIYHIKAISINEMREVLEDVNKKVNNGLLPITAPTQAKLLLGEGKKIILYGDSLSSTSHNDRYKTLIEAYTGAEVYAGGFDGYTTSMLAQDANLKRIFDYDADLILIECGGNETGEDCGTFGAVDDQTLCTPTDITENFNGQYMIQAVDHMLRKINAHYYDVITRAGVDLPIDTSNLKEKVAAVDAVKKPYIAIWTTLPQKRSSEGSPYSNPYNWLHKRNAIVEVCNLHGFHCIDIYSHNGIDWSKEPYYNGEYWQRINGIYTHDGVHPNPWGYEKICNIIAGSLL